MELNEWDRMKRNGRGRRTLKVARPVGSVSSASKLLAQCAACSPSAGGPSAHECCDEPVLASDRRGCFCFCLSSFSSSCRCGCRCCAVSESLERSKSPSPTPTVFSSGEKLVWRSRDGLFICCSPLSDFRCSIAG